MAATAEARAGRGTFLGFLAVELAPREGRALAVAHMVTACVLTVIIAMVFRIPEPTYMAYIVFLISKDERSATVTTGIGGQLAVTLAILLTLGLMLVDLSEPALRLPAMALSTFIAMYSVRTFALGPIMFLAGFVIVMLQSVVDDVPSPEALTHVALWLWVVLLVPVAITLIVNLLFGQSVVLLTRRTVLRVLSELETALLAGAVHKHLARWRELLVSLAERQPPANAAGPRRPAISAAALARLVDALVILETLSDSRALRLREAWARTVRACRATLADGSATRGVWTALAVAQAVPAAHALSDAPPSIASDLADEGAALPARAFDTALSAFQQELTQPSPPATTPRPHKHPLLVADAFTNPTHWQFALKTTLAVLIVYFIYSMLDWPGMRTSIVTCFFVALGSLGETVHKLVLRISGALIGGLIAGLCIVYVLPHMTDIGQLSLLIAVVTAAAGWVATSSELLSYAGLQIAFAFFLGILQDYAPATDLTVLRDRIAGILLGNLVITLVFTLLWPQSATSGLRSALTSAQQAIEAVRKRTGVGADARARAAQALARAYHFNLVSLFELRMLPKHSRQDAQAPQLAQLERAAGEAFVATYDIP